MHSPRFLRLLSFLSATAFVVGTVSLSRAEPHFHFKLLLIQYAFLLPAAMLYFSSHKAAGGLVKAARRDAEERGHPPISAIEAGHSPCGPGAQIGYRPGSSASGYRVSPMWLYAAYLVLAVVLTWGIHKQVPSGDESAYVFQARIFREGRIAAEGPPPTSKITVKTGDFRFHHHRVHLGKWFAKYPPGWPLVLSLGSFVFPGWLVNPLLGLLTLWIIHRIGNSLFGASTAVAAVFLAVASPYFLFNSVGFLSHPACAALLAAASLFFFRGQRSKRISDFAWMLLFLAAAALVRPYTAVCMGAAMGLSALWVLREDRGRVIRLAVLGFISVASAGLLLMLHYQALTGSFFMSPYALERGSGSLGDITLDPRLVLKHLPVLTRWSVQGTALYAFPFLWIMSVYALVADRRRELYFLAALFMSLVVGHLLVVAPTGTRFGERIWFEAYFGAAILGARGWLLFAERRQLPRHATHVVLAAAFAVQGLYYIKLAGEARARFEPHYRVQQAIQELAVSDAVIFLKNAPGFQARDLNLNQADWKASSQFYMPDPGTERRALVVKALGKRRWLVIAYDSGTRRARVEEVVDSP